LKACIEKHCEISCDWTGSAYCGIKLDWDYKMPGYIKAALHKFQHLDPTHPENAPHTWNPPVYGAKAHFIEAQENDPLLPPKVVTQI
jgi:hypothetical protein